MQETTTAPMSAQELKDYADSVVKLIERIMAYYPTDDARLDDLSDLKLRILNQKNAVTSEYDHRLHDLMVQTEKYARKHIPEAEPVVSPKFIMTGNYEAAEATEFKFKVILTGTVSVENKKAIHAAVERMFEGIAATIQKISIKTI